MMTDKPQKKHSVVKNQNSQNEVQKYTDHPKAIYNDHIVMGVIGSDSHAIGNRILEYALSDADFNITNLGSFVSQKDFINAAIEMDAKAVLVSSLGGHAAIDCEGFKEKLVESGLEHILLYIGGILAVGKTDWNSIEKHFSDMGFDRIAKPNTRPITIIDWLNNDLSKFH